MKNNKENKKTITWRDFIYPLCTIMAILTFAFFAPLETIHTDKGDIKCSVLEIMKLEGHFGTAEALIYFVVGWIVAVLLDRTLIQKFMHLFSKENRAAKYKAKNDLLEEKQRYKDSKAKDAYNEEDDEEVGY